MFVKTLNKVEETINKIGGHIKELFWEIQE
jgi:hypothetical protein